MWESSGQCIEKADSSITGLEEWFRITGVQCSLFSILWWLILWMDLCGPWGTVAFGQFLLAVSGRAFLDRTNILISRGPQTVLHAGGSHPTRGRSEESKMQCPPSKRQFSITEASDLIWSLIYTHSRIYYIKMLYWKILHLDHIILTFTKLCFSIFHQLTQRKLLKEKFKNTHYFPSSKDKRYYW